MCVYLFLWIQLILSISFKRGEKCDFQDKDQISREWNANKEHICSHTERHPLLAHWICSSDHALCPQIPRVQQFNLTFLPSISVCQEGRLQCEWQSLKSLQQFISFFMLHAPIYIFGWHAWLVCLITVNCSTAQLLKSDFCFSILLLAEWQCCRQANQF